MEKLLKVDTICRSLHMKEYEVRCHHDKISVVYDNIEFKKLKHLKMYIELKKKIKSLKSL